tara:strand:+ start:753 stop:986 length:234 start_codon:yes stop_codon:yes gene_type:complete
MKTLLQQLKPKYIKKIKSSKYTSQSERMLAKLESYKWYGELTINELSEIYGMCDIDRIRVSAWDMRFGDNVLIKGNE